MERITEMEVMENAVDETVMEFTENAYDETVQILVDCLKEEKPFPIKLPSIFKVSSLLRDLSPSSFEPRMVPIGPLHVNYNMVQQFGLKESYVRDLFHRSEYPEYAQEETLKECFQKVKDSIHLIRSSYAGMVITDCDIDLAKMVFMDGCFIIEFCFKQFIKDTTQQLLNKMQTLCIAIDLMLVENQIPFFVLQDIYDCTIAKIESKPLTEILHKVLVNYFHPFLTTLPYVATQTNPDHLLGFFHKCYQPTDAMPTNPADVEPSQNSEPASHSVEGNDPSTHSVEGNDLSTHSVVELYRSRVNFKPHTKSGNLTNDGENDIWPMTMIFKSYVCVCSPLSLCKSTLSMPTLVIDDFSERIFRNFIAYEQCLPRAGHYSFTSYAYAMDMLIDTHEDVSKLVGSKVICNKLGSNEEAANMINKICKHASLVDFCYTREFKQIDDYYNGYWPRNIAWLRRTYFNNPWNIIALIAGFVLFSLAIAQTVSSFMAL